MDLNELWKAYRKQSWKAKSKKITAEKQKKKLSALMDEPIPINPKRHQQFIGGTFLCDVCNKYYANVSSLNAHRNRKLHRM